MILVVLASLLVVSGSIVVLRSKRRAALWVLPSLLGLALFPAAVSTAVGAYLIWRGLSALAETGSGGIAMVAMGLFESQSPVFWGVLAGVGLVVMMFIAAAIMDTRTVDAGPPALPYQRGETVRVLVAILLPLVGFVAVALLLLLQRHLIGLVVDVLSEAPTPGPHASIAEVSDRIGRLIVTSVLGGIGGACYLIVAAVLAVALAPRRRRARWVWVMGIVLLAGLTSALVSEAVAIRSSMRFFEETATIGRFPGTPAEEAFTTTPPPEPPPELSNPQAPPGTRVEGGIEGGVIGGVPGDLPMKATVSEKEPLRVGGDVPPPRLVERVTPEYPDAAKSAGVQGFVILELTIDREGRVREARVLHGVPLLDEAAKKAVLQWKYEPVRQNGVAVSIYATVIVEFRPDQEGAHR